MDSQNPFESPAVSPPRSADDGPAASGFVVRLARAMGMDRAVGFAVLARFWQLLTGPVTQLLIVMSFTETTQGYYFAFSYLLGMQIFVELGLHVVIINVASHEWSRLSLRNGRLQGDPTAMLRLISLGRLTFHWYLAAAVLFVAIVSVAGCFFFTDSARLKLITGTTLEQLPWLSPWLVLVLLTGLQLALLPLTALLEGCDQLTVINRVRFWQNVAGTLTVWLLISSGAGLWALAGSAGIRLLGELYLVLIRYREFFKSFREAVPGSSLNWRQEVLPLQWRIAIQGILLWFVNGVPGLVIFRYHSEAEAGRLGMTWTILTALQAASMAWIETRRPQFGSLIAAGQYGDLDRLFFRMTRIAMSLIIGAAAALTLAVWWIGTRNEWLFERIAGRMLSFEATALFALAVVLMQFALCTNLYVRAHKRDPFLAASIVSSVTIAFLEIRWGITHRSTGVAFGYLIGVGCVQLPLWTTIWWWTRRQWHPPGAADE